MITQYARTSSSSTRAVAGNQFVIGDSEDEDEEEEEGEGMDHVDIVIMSSSLSSDHDQIGYSGPDGLRRRPPAMGEVGRKVTRDNKLETYHSVSECGFQVPKTYQAAAHIWGLPR